jgi:hypothetical protein
VPDSEHDCLAFAIKKTPSADNGLAAKRNSTIDQGKLKPISKMPQNHMRAAEAT